MTPQLLTVLLHLQSLKTDESVDEFGTDADLAELISLDLIKNETHVVTEKGEAYISALMMMPMPEKRWVVPGVGVYNAAVEVSLNATPPQKTTGKKGAKQK